MFKWFYMVFKYIYFSGFTWIFVVLCRIEMSDDDNGRCDDSGRRLNFRDPRYRSLVLRPYYMGQSFTDFDNLTVFKLPITLLYKFIDSEVELCRKYKRKAPSYNRNCCVIDHLAYVFIDDNMKGPLMTALVNGTGHKYLMPSAKRNVFLGLPTPRRVSFHDFFSACVAVGIREIDVQVYGQKAGVESYSWLSQLPSTSGCSIDFG